MKIEREEPSDSHHTHPEHEAPSAREMDPRKKKLIAGVLVAVIVIGVFSTISNRNPESGLVRTVSSIFPLSAVSVDGHKVRMREYIVEYEALLKYHDSLEEEVDEVKKDEIQTVIIDTLINKKVIQILADRHGVELTDEMVDAYYSDVVLNEGGQEAFEAEAKEMFGWDDKEFKARIVEPIVLALELSRFVVTDPGIQSEKRALADASLARIRDGDDFVEVAREVHTQEEVLFEVDLGFVKLSALPEELTHVLATLEEEEVTDVIDLPDAFVIFELQEKIVAGDDSQLHLYSLTVPKKSLEDLAKEYLLTAEVKRYIKS